MTTKTRQPKSLKTTSKLLRTAMLPCLLTTFAPVTLAGIAIPASAQSRVQQQRTCEGQVVNGAGQPVSGAVVYLKDPKSLAIRSYLSDDQGHFHFAQIQPDTDYEVWAESNGKQTKTKRIGMFDNHNKFEFTLKMEEK